jgi:hypothetical protein
MSMSHDLFPDTDTPTKAGKRRIALRAAAVVGAAALVGAATAGSALAAVGAGTPVAHFTLAQKNTTPGTIFSETSVANNQWVDSYQLDFQADGNLVVYFNVHIQSTGANTRTALWATGQNSNVKQLDWSQSGYLKLENASGTALCTLGAGKPAPGGVAQLQQDGNFVFYTTGGTATWATGTESDTSQTKSACF